MSQKKLITEGGVNYRYCNDSSCDRKGELLHLETNFYKHKGGMNGRRAICKKCFHKRYGEKLDRNRRQRSFLDAEFPFLKEEREEVLQYFNGLCALSKEKNKIGMDHFALYPGVKRLKDLV
ncbi:hypothetical protein ACQCVK_22250 [Rossellomorea vietnamensis]|uniref:hypothetical protein n=1 Tax=Rossellomorea vietnamensis TaxID=218284 RepID=UPI003CE9CE55